MRGARARLAAGAVALGLLLAVLALAALSVDSPPSAVQQLITRDFGSRVLRRSGPLKARANETVISLLTGSEAVQTGAPGRSVRSIDGLSSERTAPEPLEWSYYVNGVEALATATATSVHPGDHVWWDLHEGSRAGRVPAVVGSFPEPFLNGVEGKRLPVRVECSSVSGDACRSVITRLRALSVPAAVAAIGSGAAPETLRVMVAPWGQLEAAMAQRLERGPRATGVYAHFLAGGAALALLDQRGRTVQTLRAGAGLIAATRQEKEAPLWVLTGTDEAGVTRAADAFDRATLQDRFAVAIAPGGAVALPELRR